MRRASVVLGSLVLLVLVFVAADRITHAVVERNATESLATTGLEFSPDAAVTLSGFPFLTQLVSGRLTEATVTADSVVVDGVELTDVEGVARGVSTRSPYTAAEATLTATAPPATLTDAVASSQLGELGFDVDITVEEGRIVAASRLLGLPVEVTMVPEAAGTAIGVGLESFALAGFTVSAEDLPAPLREALDTLEVPLEGLPEGLAVTAVEVVPDGLRVTATGTDVLVEAVGAVNP